VPEAADEVVAADLDDPYEVDEPALSAEPGSEQEPEPAE
jgi:hypothetical protein